MKVWWRIAHRWNEARHRRALRLAYIFKSRSEKFYRRIKGYPE